jgi:hypothetical protein
MRQPKGNGKIFLHNINAQLVHKTRHMDVTHVSETHHMSPTHMSYVVHKFIVHQSLLEGNIYVMLLWSLVQNNKKKMNLKS